MDFLSPSIQKSVLLFQREKMMHVLSSVLRCFFHILLQKVCLHVQSYFNLTLNFSDIVPTLF